ncbi:MAG: cell division protein FtsW [Myxococcota bacterium]|jgi:cell division protein FtsW
MVASVSDKGPTAIKAGPRRSRPRTQGGMGLGWNEVRRVAPYDFPLLAAVVMMLGLGAVMVYSATINESTMELGDGAAKLKTHLMHVALGVGLLIFATLTDYRRWKTLVYPALAGTVLLLVLVIVAGFEAGNARRWIRLPGFNMQPVEVAKLTFVFFLAYSLAKKGSRIRRFTVAFVPHFMVCSVLILLCLFQPDFGTSVILVLLMFTLLFVAGTKLSYITLFIFVGGFMAFQAIASNDMRLGRVMAAINPWAYRNDIGWHSANAQIAFGSGEITGQGLGYGGQTLTGNLPEGETDFILAIIGEQLGMIGVFLVALLVGTLLYRGLRIALKTEDPFGRFLAFGITLLLVLQASINMLVAVTLIPTKGLTLPFISYGGSSMLVSCFAVGVLLSISRQHGVETVRAYVGDFQEPAEIAPRARHQKAPKGRVSAVVDRIRNRGKDKRQNLDEVLR